MRVKGTVKAWTTSQWFDIAHIENLVKDDQGDDAAQKLSYTNSDMSDTADWVEVGIATITVEFFPREAIVSKQIEGLREQLRQHRINAEQAEQAILSQISKLTAITA